MGGNALKIAQIERCDNNKYLSLSNEIILKLNNYYIKTHLIKSYKNKESYGDIDIICCNNNNINYKSIIENLFKPTEIYHNGDVFSFDYKKTQIDLIISSENNFETSINYFNYELGNFIGRIAAAMGFRYGHYGLKFQYRHEDGGKIYEKIISQDIDKILDFLGFDVKKYHEGFIELKDIFDFVINSYYFNPRIFDYNKLNHQNRTRNKKRKNYTAFLEYIKTHHQKENTNPAIDINYTVEPNYDGSYEYLIKNRDKYLKKADIYFNINLTPQIEEWKKEIEGDKLISAKFNGNLIMAEMPELKGKELGNLITKFKTYVTEKLEYKNYKIWIEKNDEKTIMTIFKIIYKLYQAEKEYKNKNL